MSTRPNPLDGTAVIPLPPGMALDQFLIFQSSLVSVSISAAIAFGIVVWDYFYLLRPEYTLYSVSKAAEWKTLAPWSFVSLRCFGVVAILASLCVSSFQSEHCQLGTSIFQGGAVIVVAWTGIAFGNRVINIWDNKKAIFVIVGSLYITMVSSWIAVASQYRAINGPPTPFGSNCRLTPFVSWAPLSHGGSTLFNVAILIMAMLKSVDQRAQQSRTNYLAYRNSMIYIAITTAASVTVLVVQSLGSDHQMVKQAILPFSTLITATMGARVFLNAKLAKATSQQTQDIRLTATPLGRLALHLTDKVAHFDPGSGQDSTPISLNVKLSENPYTTFPSPPHPTSAIDSPPKGVHARLPQNPYTLFPSPPSSVLTSGINLPSPRTPPTRFLPAIVFPTPPGKRGSPISFKSKFSLPPLVKGNRDARSVQESGWK